MSIYQDSSTRLFKPTFLYIKQHKVTGLKYFGKTVKKDPVKYLGSGTYWTRHLKKHGKLIDTLWYRLFTDKEELKEFALKFSFDNNIVESSEWANLKIEDGLSGGGVKGIKIKPHTTEHKERISAGLIKSNLRLNKKKKPKIKKERRGWTWSEEAKKNHSKRQIGFIPRKMCCIHCRKESGIANICQWHGDKCKLNPVKKNK